MCIVYAVNDVNVIPAIFVLFKRKSYEIFKRIMYYLLNYSPCLSAIETITTELDENIIKAIRRCFQNAKIRSTLFYFQKETTSNWKNLGLQFDEEHVHENKILKYCWAAPLAAEHDNKANTFKNVIEILLSQAQESLDLNTTKFVNDLECKWSSRLKYVLPYSTYEIQNDIEAIERQLELDFCDQTVKTLKILEKMMKTITGFKINNSIYKLFKAKDKRNITDAGKKLRDERWSLEQFLANCLTGDSITSLYYKMDIEPSMYNVTADIRDLEDPKNSSPDIRMSDRYMDLSTCSNPSQGREHKRQRKEKLDDIIDNVAAGTSDTDSTFFKNISQASSSSSSSFITTPTLSTTTTPKTAASNFINHIEHKVTAVESSLDESAADDFDDTIFENSLPEFPTSRCTLKSPTTLPSPPQQTITATTTTTLLPSPIITPATTTTAKKIVRTTGFPIKSLKVKFIKTNDQQCKVNNNDLLVPQVSSLSSTTTVPATSKLPLTLNFNKINSYKIIPNLSNNLTNKHLLLTLPKTNIKQTQPSSSVAHKYIKEKIETPINKRQRKQIIVCRKEAGIKC
ncbi:uncharacterized protein LOC122854977 [Aphidius gifuensis]|nr:uncharacterized protein LOC122854977 [Aphidius gifuensis]XP_044011976.1 uncharacterized protein LOC122854977 [Aphidius gifuensis]XP_044011977.1 uncharacterized protein LOC122854977 [Aphidius gifuensis]XP_044011978.1 uncharacterized protein LOC122854977 [Aphidius gifuensis]XP_044011979.1 uncharacterized protein LOC122854977 [Aphidius gifuensis]XP_044011980.1 uncharacterized protein LOC122854977 [Aphidius gifuensis]